MKQGEPDDRVYPIGVNMFIRHGGIRFSSPRSARGIPGEGILPPVARFCMGIQALRPVYGRDAGIGAIITHFPADTNHKRYNKWSTNTTTYSVQSEYRAL